MAHVRGVLYTTPERTKEILDKLKDVKLKAEGETTKGYCRPQIRILTPIDINVYEQCIPELLDVMSASNIFDKQIGDNCQHHIPKPAHMVLRLAHWVYLKLTRQYYTKRNVVRTGKKITNGWWYFFHLSDQKDPVQKGDKHEAM